MERIRCTSIMPARSPWSTADASARRPSVDRADRRARRRRGPTQRCGRRDRRPGRVIRRPTAPCPGRVAGCGPKRTGGSAPTSASQAASNSASAHPDRSAECLVVRPSVRIRADQRHQGILAVRPDEEVDRADALGVGEEEGPGGGRELAPEADQRDHGRVVGGGVDRRAIRGVVPLAEVDGEALVEPARREVVRDWRRRYRRPGGPARAGRPWRPTGRRSRPG